MIFVKSEVIILSTTLIEKHSIQKIVINVEDRISRPTFSIPLLCTSKFHMNWIYENYKFTSTREKKCIHLSSIQRPSQFAHTPDNAVSYFHFQRQSASACRLRCTTSVSRPSVITSRYIPLTGSGSYYKYLKWLPELYCSYFVVSTSIEWHFI